MTRRFGFVAWIVLAAALPGCGVRSVRGGTAGTLQFRGEKLSDIQVTVHQIEGTSTRPVGFGLTSEDGSFQLLKTGAQGALWLTPGEYRCTLESAGAPIRIPKEYMQCETTPLKVSWSAGDKRLDLEVPQGSNR